MYLHFMEVRQKESLLFDNVSVKENILNIIGQIPTIAAKELAKIVSVSERTIYTESEWFEVGQ